MNTKIKSPEEFAEWLAKFEVPHTTDECFTPPAVYSAVCEWIEKEYGVSRERFVRPFYPGGDFQSEIYAPEDIVVDNPPFSLLGQIVPFYLERGIPFFLFAPGLMLATRQNARATLVAAAAQIIYENGANVNTGFVTNLDDPEVQIRSAPDLCDMIRAANTKATKTLPKYRFPRNVVTAAMVNRLSSNGVLYKLKRSESVRITTLDAMEGRGKKSGIFGGDFLHRNAQLVRRKKLKEEWCSDRLSWEK